MTTYCYDPGIGVTAVNDPTDTVTYYEYDAHGRLTVIKDQDGNIMKTYQYHYKSGPGNQ